MMLLISFVVVVPKQESASVGCGGIFVVASAGPKNVISFSLVIRTFLQEKPP
jgi:hypothetical protein